MSIFEDFIQVVGEDRVRKNEPLSAHTTFHIGGAAKLFVAPASMEELEQVLCVVQKSGEPYVVLGNGSNLLVSDSGYEGVVIATHGWRNTGKKDSGVEVLGREGSGIRNLKRRDALGSLGLQEFLEVSEKELLDRIERDTGQQPILPTWDGKRLIVAGSGILLSALANGVAGLGLCGFEFASGIPGTLGGAVVMNAGAYGGEIKDDILGALVFQKDGKKCFFTKEQLELSYRSSRIQREDGIVLYAAFAFAEGEETAIREKMREFNERRRQKQPLSYGSAGSTFKRPEGHFAGKLIEDAGLKGYRVGDVMVSEKHAGFVVNVGNGTCEQALAVIQHVQEVVQEKFGIALETEVKFL